MNFSFHSRHREWHIVSFYTSQSTLSSVLFSCIYWFIEWKWIHGSVWCVGTLCLVFVNVVCGLILHASHCQSTLANHIIIELC